MLFSKRMLLGLAAMAALALCWPAAGVRAGGYEIEADSRAAMERFFHDVPSSRELANKAAGILVFPMVVKAGFGFGGEYGEGALFIGGRPAGFYNDVAGSFGFQFASTRTFCSVTFLPSQLRSTDSSTSRMETGSFDTGPTPAFSKCGSE